MNWKKNLIKATRVILGLYMLGALFFIVLFAIPLELVRHLGSDE